jgi:uncharacterized membrane protein YbhN (UPF0104 family)
MTKNKRIKDIAWLALKGSLVAVLLWWLVKSQAISWKYFTFSSQSVPWIALGAVSIFASIMMTGTRYWMILKANGIHQNLPLVLRTELAATFFNICSIGPMGGDIVRTYYISKFGGAPLTVAGSTIVDRLIGLYALLILACLAIIFCDTDGISSPILQNLKFVVFGAVGGVISLGMMGAIRYFSRVFYTLLIGFSATITCLLLSFFISETKQADTLFIVAAASVALSTILTVGLSEGRLKAAMNKLKTMGGLSAHIAMLIEAILMLKDNAFCVTKSLCLSLIQQSTFVLAMLAFAKSLPLPVSPSLQDIVFATPMTFILAIFPMPGAGLGINEAAFDYLLTLSSPEIVGGASIFLFFRAWLLIVSMTGIPFYLSSMKKR